MPTANVDLVVNLAEDELRTYDEKGRLICHAGAVIVLESPTAEEKIAVVERMLLGAAATSEPDAAVEFAVAALERGESVRAVSDWLEISEKRFARLFQRAIGLTPKRFSRISRLHRLLHSVHQVGDVDWAVGVAEHGYFDQSHLIRDFRDLTGMTSTAYTGTVTAAATHVAFVQSHRSSEP